MTLLTPVPDAPDQALGAVEQRLRSIAAHLLPVTTGGLDPALLPVGDLLMGLVERVRASGRSDEAWLLLVALAGAFPEADDLQQVRRELELRDPVEGCLWLMDSSLARAAAAPTSTWPMEVVTGQVLVDVDFSAQHDLHTGIQRVVRSTLPRWSAEHDIVPVVWTAGHQAMRRLSPAESARVFRWGASPGPRPDGVDEIPRVLTVPWRCTVVLAEVPQRAACERYAAMAQAAANRLVAIGYDAIPVVSADLVPLAEPNRFVHFLTVVKYLSAIVGISVSATAEFRGFADSLGAQGLPGPAVTECGLPVDGVHTQAQEPDDAAAEPLDTVPLILCVGSREPRKNQLAVLWAAEVLWREGQTFRLTFVGGGGWGTDFPRAVRRARRQGRPVEVLTAIDEAALDTLYRTSRFSVFVSVHEGYGLPVAESLARGRPVVVTDYGSTREIGAAGGVLLVDPRDDDAIVCGMRTLLTDEDAYRTLLQEVGDRPSRTWRDYAAELWLAFGLPAGSAA